MYIPKISNEYNHKRITTNPTCQLMIIINVYENTLESHLHVYLK